jgi:hypothetical protein
VTQWLRQHRLVNKAQVHFRRKKLDSGKKKSKKVSLRSAGKKFALKFFGGVLKLFTPFF